MEVSNVRVALPDENLEGITLVQTIDRHEDEHVIYDELVELDVHRASPPLPVLKIHTQLPIPMVKQTPFHTPAAAADLIKPRPPRPYDENESESESENESLMCVKIKDPVLTALQYWSNRELANVKCVGGHTAQADFYMNNGRIKVRVKRHPDFLNLCKICKMPSDTEVVMKTLEMCWTCAANDLVI